MDTTEKPRTEKATRPASRWRNRYLALCYLGDEKEFYRPGQKFWGPRDWPTRDTAETYAQSYMFETPGAVEYLGAFPVEGA